MDYNATITEVARARARELPTRVGLALFIGLTVMTIAPSWFVAAWAVAVAATQWWDWKCFKPFRAADGATPTREETIKAFAALFLATAAYSATSVYLWFWGGEAGKVFCVIQTCGGLLHVSLGLYKTRWMLVAAVTPHASYLLGLPLLSALLDDRLPPESAAVIGVGGLLYLAHLVTAVRRASSDNDAVRQERARAEEASRAKSDFLATVTHEIRTPMNAVVSAGVLLQRTPLTEEQAQHVKMLSNASEVLMGLLNDVLDLSKIEAGKMKLEEAEISLPESLKALETLWEAPARDKGLKLELSLSPNLPERVCVDPLRLKQILFNLLSNAVKFTDHGTVTLRARRVAEEAGLMIAFEVQDTGCGIDPADIDRLFDSFEQADAGTTRRHGGTGLGLAISKRLARLMGGDLTVSSAVGQGSTFRLLLPAREQRAPVVEEGYEDEAVEAAVPAVFQSASELSLLVAEDHEVNRRIVAMFLEPLGWRLTMVENGQEAVEAAKVERFDCILMDMQMPVMDGPDATRAIRAAGGPNATTPVVALTANALDHHRQVWAEVGVHAFLTKPIDPRVLTATIMAAVSPAEGAAGSSAAA